MIALNEALSPKTLLSQRERKGPEAKPWEGEGLHPQPARRHAVSRLNPSPSHAAHGPLPLPLGEGSW